jgi:hypothetical protein
MHTLWHRPGPEEGARKQASVRAPSGLLVGPGGTQCAGLRGGRGGRRSEARRGSNSASAVPTASARSRPARAGSHHVNFHHQHPDPGRSGPMSMSSTGASFVVTREQPHHPLGTHEERRPLTFIASARCDPVQAGIVSRVRFLDLVAELPGRFERGGLDELEVVRILEDASFVCRVTPGRLAFGLRRRRRHPSWGA